MKDLATTGQPRASSSSRRRAHATVMRPGGGPRVLGTSEHVTLGPLRAGALGVSVDRQFARALPLPERFQPPMVPCLDLRAFRSVLI